MSEITDDHLQAIRERLAACDALRNLPQEEIGTLRHRMLDDIVYDSTTEMHIRALLDAYDAAQVHNKALQHDLDWCKREKTEALETLTSWQDIEPQLDEARQRIEALETALQEIADLQDTPRGDIATLDDVEDIARRALDGD